MEADLLIACRNPLARPNGFCLAHQVLASFMLLISLGAALAADESIQCDFSQEKKVIKIDLGVVQPKSMLKRTLLVSGVRSKITEELTISPDCGCVSVVVGERTTGDVMELHVTIASSNKDGKSEQKIGISRESDSEVLGTLVFAQDVQPKVRLIQSVVDVTDLLGREIELSIAIPDAFANEEVVLKAVSGEGEWLADAGARLGADSKAIVLRVKDKVDGAEFSSLQRLRFEWSSNAGPGRTEVDVVFTRKLTLHPLKSSLWLTEDGESLSGKLWLRGSAGIADDIRTLDGELVLGTPGSPNNELLKVLFRRQGGSLWIGKVVVTQEFLATETWRSYSRSGDGEWNLKINGLVFPISLSISGSQK